MFALHTAEPENAPASVADCCDDDDEGGVREQRRNEQIFQDTRLILIN